MAQGKLKKKMQLPKGVKQKVKKVKPVNNGPKKGTKMILPPKKSTAVQQAKIGSAVSQIINEKNEHMIRMRANQAQGRTSKPHKK